MNIDQMINFFNNHTIPVEVIREQLEELSNNRDAIMAVLKSNPDLYKHMSEKLRNDPEILRTALESNKMSAWDITHYAGPGALTKENIKLAIDKEALDQYNIRQYFPDLLNDKEIMLYYIETVNEGVYRIITDKLQGDRDIILAAVKKDINLYQIIPEEFRNDPEILHIALLGASIFSWDLIKYAGPGALTDENIKLAIDKGILDGFRTQQFVPYLLNNKEIMIYYIRKKDASIYEYLSDELRNDPDILKEVLEKTEASYGPSNPLVYAGPGALTKENLFLSINKKILTMYTIYNKLSYLLGNKEIMIYYIRTFTPDIYEYLSPELRSDPEVLKAVVEEKRGPSNNPFEDALPGAITRENVLLGIENGILTTHYIINHLSEYLGDKEVMMYYIREQDASIYEYLTIELRSDPEVLKNVLTYGRRITTWDNPLNYALPEALTKENFLLAIDKQILQLQMIKNIFNYLLDDKEIMVHFIKTINPYIYEFLSERLRNDPEILRETLLAIKRRSDYNRSPIYYAGPGALTKENVMLAIDKELIGTIGIKEELPQLLKDKELMIYYIENNNKNIYSYLSPELRSDPEVLKAVIEQTRNGRNGFIEYALPEAFTNEIIDLMISCNLYPNTNNLLNNKYYILRAIEKYPQILAKVSKELKKDPDIQRLSLVFNPKFLNIIGAKSLNEYMVNYAKKYNLEIDENNIVEIILSDEDFLKRIIASSPKVYTLLPKEKKNDIDIINIILSINGNNLIYVPNEFITDEMLEKAMDNGYTLSIKHYQLFTDYYKRRLKENPDKVFSYFIDSNNTEMNLLILQAIATENVSINSLVEEKMNNIIEPFIKKFKKAGIEEQYINNLIMKIKNGEVCALNLLFIIKDQMFEDILYATNFGNIFSIDNIRQTKSLKMRALLANTASFDIYTKTNTKQYKILKKKLLDMGLNDFDATTIALKGYSALGFARMEELLNGKYGPVDYDKLSFLFYDLNCFKVAFEPDGNNFKPIINEQLINLLFGSNYKVENTPIRNYLCGFSEMDQYIKKEIKKIKENKDIPMLETIERINAINEGYTNYRISVIAFIADFNFTFNNWYIIQEEFLKKQSVSKLKIKLNISQINEIVRDLDDVRRVIKTKDISKGLTERQQLRYQRIPNYEPRDYPLIQSDVFDYVGIQTQYTNNPHMAPNRAVELSRMMENKTTKKIPNVNLEYESYSIKVFNPQDRNIISGGYRSGCCFRPNGNADNYGRGNNSLLVYCCATEYGSGVEIRDRNGRTLMFSPLLRNGNVLMVHSFESIGLSEHEQEVANTLLFNWAEEVIKVSQEEEKNQGIIAVTMTDLHERFDRSLTKGILPSDKQFKPYDPDGEFVGMYNNLYGHNHYVLALAKDKTMQDIVYDEEVDKSYQYPYQIDIKTVSVTGEQLEIITEIIGNKDTIIELANKRKEYLDDKKHEQAFEMIKQINELRKANITLQKKLYDINPNAKKDILTDYIDGLEMANQVCDELHIERQAETLGFRQIFYSDGWYLGITHDKKLYGNCLNGFTSQFFSVLSDIKKNYGLELEVNNDIMNNHDKAGNGGHRP